MAAAPVSPRDRTQPRWRRGVRIVILGLASLVVLALTLLGVARTAVVNRAFDRRALRMMATVLAQGTAPDRPGVARLGDLPYTNEAALEALTRPTTALAPQRRPLEVHRRSDAGLIQEELLFPSRVKVAHAVSNQARAFVYRHGPLGARPVVLWVPGQYVVDIAFVPIGWFLDQLLPRGLDVVFYVPPYHLARTPAGFESGDAMLATTLPDQLAAFAQELSDLRALAGWLRAQRPPAVGAFGASFGGLALLRIAGWDDSLDFLTVMMPPVRLDVTLLAAPEADPARARFLREGWAIAEVAGLYRLLDPTSARPRLPSERISVLYGSFDLVAPARPIQAWADAWDVRRRHSYPRGHVLLLFTPGLYADYGRLLDQDLTALATRVPPGAAEKVLR